MKPQTDQILARWRAAGYQIGPVVHDTGRNRSHRLERDGQTFFAKLALTKDLVAMENDVWWALTMQRLAGDEHSSLVRAPRVQESGPGWLISEWVGAPLLEPYGFNQGEAKIAPHAERLATALAWLDGLWQPTTTKVIYDDTDSAPYSDLMRKVDSWLEQPLAAGRIKAADVAAAKRLIANHRPHLHPAFQHGDFVPWHLFVANEQQLILFDGEHASLVKPRFYDLAYLYSRLYTRSSAPQAAREILRRYLGQTSLADPVFAQAFLPVITLRALGMHADAWADRDRFEYNDRAADLLARCLSSDLTALITA